MELGLAGAAVFAAVVAVVARPLRAALRAPLPERALVLGPLAGCVAIVVHGFVDVNLHIPSNALLATVSLSLAYGAALGAGLQQSPEIADEQAG
jgi:O-antigen ligase